MCIARKISESRMCTYYGHNVSYFTVHNPNQVKITDFGLAKLLDYEEEEIHSEGGKVSFSSNIF